MKTTYRIYCICIALCTLAAQGVLAQQVQFHRIQAETNTAITGFSQQKVLTWTAAATGGAYSIQRSTNLLDKSWSNVTAGKVETPINTTDVGDQTIPTGCIMPYAGSTAPSGWLLCDGSAVDRFAYTNLFAIINTTFGTGDGSTTFNLPDLRGRVTLGRDNMGGRGQRGHVSTFDK